MTLNGKQSYSINLNTNYSIVHDFEEVHLASEESYINFCRGIGIPHFQSFLLANFANKFHMSLPSSHIVSRQDLVRGLYQTMAYYRSIGHDKTLLKVSDLERLMDEKELQILKLRAVKDQLDLKAKKKAQRLLSLGSLVMVG